MDSRFKNYTLFHMITVLGQSNMHMILDNSNTVTVVNLERKQESYTEIQINIKEILT